MGLGLYIPAPENRCQTYEAHWHQVQDLHMLLDRDLLNTYLPDGDLDRPLRECVRGIDMAKSSAPISVKHCGSVISAEVTQRTIMQRGNPRKFKD